MEESHFWVGHFKNGEDIANFVEENSDYYQEEDEDKLSEMYISEFAKSQGEHWLDHDFMEYGFEEGEESVAKKFAAYSYADQWSLELEDRIAAMHIRFPVNTLIMITKREIAHAVTVANDDFKLFYVGTIAYEI